MADNVVSAFVEAMEDAATKAVSHAERLAVEGERLLALSAELREQAAALRGGAATLQGRPAPAPAPVPSPAPAPPVSVREEVPPPVVREPEPEVVEAPEPVVTDKVASVKASGKKGAVTSAVAVGAAQGLGRFSRMALARDLGLSPIAVGKFITAMEQAGVIVAEGGEYVFQEGVLHAPPPVAPREPQEAVGGREAGAERMRALGDERREQILAFVRENQPLMLNEIVTGVGISQGNVSKHLRVLMDEGLITKTGTMKAARYHAPVAERSGLLTPTEPEPEPEQTQAEKALLEQVRDWFVERTKEFTPRQCAEALDLPVEAVTGAFDYFVERGSLIDESPGPDLPLFSYARPLEPGKAAEADRALSKRAAKAAPSTKGAPVPGTGKGVKANNPDVQQLINASIAAGAEVAHATNGHFEVKFDGKRVLIAATPRGQRTVMNDRARLRRKGLGV